MSPKISSPVEGFSGTVAGVNFVKGEGETDNPAALAYFARQGYTITETSKAEGSDKGKQPTEKQKLQAEAEELGLDAEGTVVELKQRIVEHKAEQAPTGAASEDAGKDEGQGGDE